MMRIDHYISSLLYQRDHVNLPGFGCFHVRYAGAQIHPGQHLFHPPYREISFSTEEETHDISLLRRVVEEARISETEARQAIRNFVDKVQQTLARGGASELEQVGSFQLDIEKNLKFSPNRSANYLLSSYGLDHFIAPPVLRKENILPSVNTPATLAEPAKKKIPVALRILLIVILTIFILVALFFASTYIPYFDHLYEKWKVYDFIYKITG